MASITIGIPTLNGAERLNKCLRSIFACDDAVNRLKPEIVVCDDGSEDIELEKVKQVITRYNVPLIISGERLGVARSWNKLVNHTDTGYIVLLNDDIEVTRHWLDVMLFMLENTPGVGAIGLNSYEGIMRYDAPSVLPSYIESKLMWGGELCPILSVKGSAFGFSREDHEAVNGFDHTYFAFFEEIDFCLKLIKTGKRNAILSYPILLHEGGATTTSAFAGSVQRIFGESQATFERHWDVEWKEHRSLFTDIAEEPVSPIWNSNLITWG